MEELTKMHVDWKKTAVVIALVILTGLTVGCTTWYFAEAGAQDELEAYKNEIATLETRITQLEAEEAPVEETTPDTTKSTTTWKTYSNVDHNFTLKIPTGWTTSDLTGGVRLISGSQYFDIISFVNSGSYTATTWLNNEITNGNIVSGGIKNKTTKTLGTYPSTLFDYTTTNGLSYWYVLGNSSQMIEISTVNNAPESIKTTIEQVIPTLVLK